MDDQYLDLVCGLMASQNHFFTISQIVGKFYKIDNMIQESITKGFDFFGEAYSGKADKEHIPFHLNKKSLKPRKGAVYFAVYKGPDLAAVEVASREKDSTVQSLNDVPNWTDENANVLTEPNVKKIKVSLSVADFDSIASANSSSPMLKEGNDEIVVMDNIEVVQRDRVSSVEAEELGLQEKHKNTSVISKEILGSFEDTSKRTARGR